MPASKRNPNGNGLRLAIASVLSLACATPGLAVTLGYELTVNNPVFNPSSGNLNVPDFQLTNLANGGTQITDFQLTIGNTAFNYDFVRIQSPFIDPGNDLSFSLNSVGTTNDGVGEDVLLYSFLGFDPGDVFRFEVDVDPDIGGPSVDYRDALFPAATASVTFSTGVTISSNFSSGNVTSGNQTFNESVVAPIPLPGGMSLMGIAGLLSLLVLRRRAASTVA